MKSATLLGPFRPALPILVLPTVVLGAGCFGGSSAGPCKGAACADSGGGGLDGATVDTSTGDDGGSTPVASGSTGAFGIVTVGGKQKMYLPETAANAAGNAFIAVVDVGAKGNTAAGAPAQVTTIDLGTGDYATATGGDSTMVVAVSTDYAHVWFIDPVKDALVKRLDLDASYGQSGFSGGGGYVTGVAVDSANHRAILSVWNGFALVDLAGMSITSVIQAPPSENFGFDSVHQRVLAPFYDCASSSASGQPPSTCNDPQAGDAGVMAAGLNVIDLTDGTVYTYEDPSAADPLNPLGTEPDSAAADPSSQIVLVPGEGDFENVLDFSKAAFDKGSKTVTAPHVILSQFDPEGIAIEPTSHIAFFEAEGSSDVAAVDVVRAAAGDQGSVGGTMPTLPGGSNGFSNLGDPHGIAVAASIIDGKPVGFVVDSGLQWVARVDLQGLVALEQGDASVTAGTTQMQAVVTYLDALTKE
jgi:hypothetical protein